MENVHRNNFIKLNLQAEAGTCFVLNRPRMLSKEDYDEELADATYIH